ncbi:hypothetical protein EC396_00425 [Lutibacter sp. HS1-25]|uniref:hypothetical protein n=1 Tax=Lutibacter sp. HS1-25 TaxID=2485000 RepID=UPI0010138332|nr:hypothetical protein [Lutibacter sp. HS1-25]RXP64476.1 hypothetical protein EC396_00425 [Lutibacter sp. HS1-25]
MLAGFIALLQQIDIEEKLKDAPLDYQITYYITSYLPFVLFVILAYFMYNKAKNRKDLDD